MKANALEMMLLAFIVYLALVILVAIEPLRTPIAPPAIQSLDAAEPVPWIPNAASDGTIHPGAAVPWPVPLRSVVFEKGGGLLGSGTPMDAAAVSIFHSGFALVGPQVDAAVVRVSESVSVRFSCREGWCVVREADLEVIERALVGLSQKCRGVPL